MPFLKGPGDPRRTSLSVSAFNARKLSPVFTAGPGMDATEVPSVWVDRTGAKISVHETYTRHSYGQLSLLLQDVTTFDDQGQPIATASRAGPSFGRGPDGAPPTTLSGTHRDRTATLQATIVRDATYFVNGALVGPRDVFKVDQGLGIGPGAPLFNRFEASSSR